MFTKALNVLRPWLRLGVFLAVVTICISSGLFELDKLNPPPWPHVREAVDIVGGIIFGVGLRPVLLRRYGGLPRWISGIDAIFGRHLHDDEIVNYAEYQRMERLVTRLLRRVRRQRRQMQRYRHIDLVRNTPDLKRRGNLSDAHVQPEA